MAVQVQLGAWVFERVFESPGLGCAGVDVVLAFPVSIAYHHSSTPRHATT